MVPKASGPISMSKIPSPEISTGGKSEIFGDPKSTLYMLVQSGLMDSDRLNHYTLKALTLTGVSAGSVLDVPNNITVPDNISSFNSTGGTGGKGGNGGNGGNGGIEVDVDDWIRKTDSGLSSTVKVVLGVVGALLVFGLAAAVIVVRKRRQRKFAAMQEQPSMIPLQTTNGAGARA